MALHLARKFMIGSMFSTISILCAVVVDYEIHGVYDRTGQPISVLWQIPQFFFIGAGEIFAVSAAYEAAFLIAPKNLKGACRGVDLTIQRPPRPRTRLTNSLIDAALSSATNIFLIGGLPQFISTAVLSACDTVAFTNSNGTLHLDTLPEYASAHVYYYFWILFGISLLGVAINALPVTKRFLTRTLEAASLANSSMEAAPAPPPAPADVPVALEVKKSTLEARIAERSSDDTNETPPDSTPSVIGDISIDTSIKGKPEAASMALV
jgi:POT family proton-dependent oligopeptide transporter